MLVSPVPARLRRLAMPIIAAAYLGYFGFHTFQGSYGVLAMARLTTEAQQLQAELADLNAQKNELERKAALLRPESLDPDMIDERARQSLNMLKANDFVIFDQAGAIAR